MQRPYFVPLTELRKELVVLNSRFITTIAPAFGIDEARAFMARIRREFPDASHHVPVYVIGGGNTVTEYFSDDGEPAGTSGRPALAVLRGSGLGDVVLVITRYFGGTLLGTGGLVKAYTEAAQLAVNQVARGKRMEVYIAMVAFPYNMLERLRLVAARRQGSVLGEDFGADITMTVRFPVDSFDAFQNDLRELSAGKIQAEVIEVKEMVVAV
ncbi:MAG: YigZ family protein [Chloroflexi bacterium]|nr:YigZ family protein [Chloroflexota bacterium]